MIDSYTKMSVLDIRTELIERGYTEEQVRSIKSKNVLAAMLDEERHPDRYEHDNTEVLDTLEEEPSKKINVVPTPEDIEWDDYIISLLDPRELFKNQPTVGGLRRLTQKLVGDIRKVETTIVQAPDLSNNNRATAVVGVTVLDADGVLRYADGAADFFKGNTVAYGEHPVANAETRAEGRAYRKLLKVNKLISAEEMESYTPQEPLPFLSGLQIVNDNPINDTQLIMIKKLCSNTGRGLNINVNKLVNLVTEQENKSIKTLSYDEGQLLMERLSQYQQKLNSIPDSVKGYEDNWETV